MSSHRTKRQHTTPRLVLRGFADRDGLIAKYDLKTGHAYPAQPIKEVAQAKNFYTVTAQDGEPSTVVDDWLTMIEGQAAPILRRLADGGDCTFEEWREVALFVAAQCVRGPAERELWVQTDRSLDRLRGLVPGVPSAVGGHDGALAKMVHLAAVAAIEIAASYVPVTVCWPARSLLTSDNPVLMIPDGTAVALSVRTAAGLFLGVDDSTGLLLWNEHCRPAPRKCRLQLDQARAQEFNRAVVDQSLRQVLWHPEADQRTLLGDSHELPPFREHLAPYLDDQCRRLADVLHWAQQNPDEPHPMARVPRITLDEGAKPLSPQMRRKLSDAGFFS